MNRTPLRTAQFLPLLLLTIGGLSPASAIDARAGGMASFEDERLGLQQAAIARGGFGFHDSTSFSALA